MSISKPTTKIIQPRLYAKLQVIMNIYPPSTNLLFVQHWLFIHICILLSHLEILVIIDIGVKCTFSNEHSKESLILQVKKII